MLPRCSCRPTNLCRVCSTYRQYLDCPINVPITNENFDYFFQGACAENYVASLFYFAGYEASKITPDAGIDYVVTNVARTQFLGEESVSAEVQVKSTLLDDTGASFCLSANELEFLCNGASRFTVFVLFHGFRIGLLIFT